MRELMSGEEQLFLATQLWQLLSNLLSFGLVGVNLF